MINFEEILKREVETDWSREDDSPTSIIKKEPTQANESTRVIPQSRQKNINGSENFRSKSRKFKDKWFRCKLCARVYETKAGCQSHIMVKHGNHTYFDYRYNDHAFLKLFPQPGIRNLLKSMIFFFLL